MNDSVDKLNNVVQAALQTHLNSRRYANIEDYTRQTGKRFRMTRDQVARKITREAAFEEFLQTLE